MYNRNRNEVLNIYKWGVIVRNLNEVLVLEIEVIKWSVKDRSRKEVYVL